MTQSAPAVAEVKSPLNAAQKIVAELYGMNKDDQSLALKFAMETLRLATPPSLVAAAVAPAQSPLPSSAVGVHSTERVTDLRSFKEQKQPKSDQQFTALVAYYYRFLAPTADRRETIDGELMTHAARGVWPQKRRWGMTLTNAKNAGYLDPADRGTFKLSAIGENLIAMTLPGDGSSPKPLRANGRNNNAKTPKAKSKKSAKKAR